MTPAARALALGSLSLGACPSVNVHSDSQAEARPVPAAPAAAAPASACPSFAAVASPGVLRPAAIVEASGLAASRRTPGLLWTHNDSDEAGPQVYAFAVEGARYLGRYALTGAKVRDWEDMAIGPGRDPETSALYLGDIGDNNHKRQRITVYRVPEPAVDLTQPADDRRLDDVEALDFTYPDGHAHNAETLLVDPVLGDMCILTKRKRGRSDIFCAAAPLTSGVLVHAGELDIGGLATGGAVSPDGSLIAVRTYLDARLWRRDLARPLVDALRGPACPLPLALERQGEAITFAADARGYFTVSEGALPTLHAYRQD